MKRNGIYIHIPYCLQQCPYCDFATVKNDHPFKKADYLNILLQEIENRNGVVPFRELSTVYFGGGTPSLFKPEEINAVIQGLVKAGFNFSNIEEITLEINPGTITKETLNEYEKIGITRFSVGAQTFQPQLLKKIGREHTVEQTLETLKLLKNHNYTLDLLFALPGQTIEELESDLKLIQGLSPTHVSAYCLTVPDKNPLFSLQPADETQASMFYLVEERLREVGLERYEISSYTAPGKHSRHNTLYWEDQNYWGIGMSAHSYFTDGAWGVRFWNPPHITAYQKQVLSSPKMTSRIYSLLPKEQVEVLKVHQALTDFCHTRLRTIQGLNEDWLIKKFRGKGSELVLQRLEKLKGKGVIEKTGDNWRIMHKALVLCERVYQEMTFLPGDL